MRHATLCGILGEALCWSQAGGTAGESRPELSLGSPGKARHVTRGCVSEAEDFLLWIILVTLGWGLT